MAQARRVWRIGGWLIAAFLPFVANETRAQATGASPEAPAEAKVRPPIIVGVAIDEVGISPVDLKRSTDLVLTLLDVLPKGSLMAVASFSRETRIVLPPTSDRKTLASTLFEFKPAPTGVALPDGLFDVVDYLGGLDAVSRGVLLISPGRVREGDLHFEDPMNAATTREIPIVALGLGQGDGKLLRRIARITRGEYIHLEVADATMLATALLPRSSSAPSAAIPERPTAEPVRPAEPPPSSSLLGAAAVFLALGGLLILGTIVVLVRRSSAPTAPTTPSVPTVAPPVRAAAPLPDPRPRPALEIDPDVEIFEDDSPLEKTLVVNVTPTLRALSGPGAGKNFPLSATGSTSIGRSRGNDIVVPEDAASARHCRVDREGDSYVLHDLEATNGTWVNGKKTDRATLQHGDRLKVGDTVFTVSLFGDRS